MSESDTKPLSPFQVWLIDARLNSGRTRAETAELLGLSYGNYANMENGYTQVSDERLAEFGKLLGGVPEDVLNWQKDRQTARKNRSIPRRITTNSVQTPFTLWLQRMRLKKGLTQTVLAEQMKVRLTVVRNLERGLFLPSKDNRKALTAFFGPMPDEVLHFLEEAEFKNRFSGNATAEKDLPPFGSVLRNLRLKNNLTQEELTVSLGYAPQSEVIYKIEHGRRPASEEFLQKLADIFANGVIPAVWRDALHESPDGWRPSVCGISGTELPPLGTCLADLRREHVGSRSVMAERLGMTLGELQNIEFGTVPVPMSVLERMAALFGMDKVPDVWERLRYESGQLPESEPVPPYCEGMSFGHILRSERKARHLTLKDVAAAVGITPPALHHVEYDRASLTPQRVLKLAKLFGLDGVPEKWIAALDETGRRMVKHGVIRPDHPAAGNWKERIRAAEAGEAAEKAL